MASFFARLRRQYPLKKGFVVVKGSKPLEPHNLNDLALAVFFSAQGTFNKYQDSSGTRETETNTLVSCDLPNPLVLNTALYLNADTGEAIFAAQVVCADLCVPTPLLRHIEKFTP